MNSSENSTMISSKNKKQKKTYIICGIAINNQQDQETQESTMSLCTSQTLIRFYSMNSSVNSSMISSINQKY